MTTTAWAPAATPRIIVARLNTELRAALASEDVRARIVEEGGEPLSGPPDRQAADMAEEDQVGCAGAQAGHPAE